jgi:hypothetical protein
LPQQSNNVTLVLQHLSPVQNGFRTQFVPRLCPRGAIPTADHPRHRKEIHAERKPDTSEEATLDLMFGSSDCANQAPMASANIGEQRIQQTGAGQKSHLLHSLSDAVMRSGAPADQFRRKKRP